MGFDKDKQRDNRGLVRRIRNPELGSPPVADNAPERTQLHGMIGRFSLAQGETTFLQTNFVAKPSDPGDPILPTFRALLSVIGVTFDLTRQPIAITGADDITLSCKSHRGQNKEFTLSLGPQSYLKLCTKADYTPPRSKMTPAMHSMLREINAELKRPESRSPG